MKRILFTENEHVTWFFILDNGEIGLAIRSNRTGLVLSKSISTNPEYLEFLTEFDREKFELLSIGIYETLLWTMFRKRAWYISSEHTNKDKYLVELDLEMDNLSEKLNQIID